MPQNAARQTDINTNKHGCLLTASCKGSHSAHKTGENEILSISGSLAVPARSGPAYQTDDYYTVEGIQEYLNGLARSYSQRVALTEIGRSYENRSLTTITITNGDGGPRKKAIFIDAGIHAREWLTHTTALNIINELVVNFEENKDLLKDHDWVILPLFNPDGYHYSRSGMEFQNQIDCFSKVKPDRNMTDIKIKCWRKNRKTSSHDCIGIDLNRNFGVGWNLGRAEDDPCSLVYRGPGAFTEPESRAVLGVLHHLADSDRGLLYISLHSYGTEIVYPRGYNRIKITNSRENIEVAEAGASAIAKAFPSRYKVGPGYEMALIGGASDDYAYSIGFPLSYTWELPGERNGVEFGFHPPKELIKELVEETWVGIRAMAAKAIEKYPRHQKH